jgi:hypothetical protein
MGKQKVITNLLPFLQLSKLAHILLSLRNSGTEKFGSSPYPGSLEAQNNCGWHPRNREKSHRKGLGP